MWAAGGSTRKGRGPLVEQETANAELRGPQVSPSPHPAPPSTPPTLNPTTSQGQVCTARPTGQQHETIPQPLGATRKGSPSLNPQNHPHPTPPHPHRTPQLPSLGLASWRSTVTAVGGRSSQGRLLLPCSSVRHIVTAVSSVVLHVSHGLDGMCS